MNVRPWNIVGGVSLILILCALTFFVLCIVWTTNGDHGDECRHVLTEVGGRLLPCFSLAELAGYFSMPDPWEALLREYEQRCGAEEAAHIKSLVYGEPREGAAQDWQIEPNRNLLQDLGGSRHPNSVVLIKSIPRHGEAYSYAFYADGHTERLCHP